jgi:predicted MPP superfamily phosphohydrolase
MIATSLSLTDLAYNLLMVVLVGGSLYAFRAWKTPAMALLGLPLGLIAAIVALVMARSPFDAVRFAASFLLVHFPMLLAVTAALLWSDCRKTAILAILGALTVVGVACDAYFLEPHWIETTHTELASPRIRQRIRVVVVADLQTDGFGDYERRVLKRIVEEKPDLVLFAGDYVQMRKGDRQRVAADINAALRELDLSPPLGMFAIRGNVDGGECPRCFAGLPIVFVETTQSFDLGPLQLTCLGLDNSFRQRLTIQRPSSEGYHLTVGHSPNYALGTIDADLLIAGHTHGGQICVPLFGALTTNSLIPRAWASDLTRLSQGRYLYISRGIGIERSGAPRLRFWCRPELAVIDLVPAPEP